MAKGDKKAKKGKDKIKIPKRITGVKVPKAVRQAGNAALKLVEKPAVSETVAAALLAAAAALRDPPATRRAAGVAGEAGKGTIQLGDQLRKMAIDMARRTLDAWDSAESRPRGSGGGAPDGEPGKG